VTTKMDPSESELPTPDITDPGDDRVGANRIPPLSLIKILSDEEWEDFVFEWATTLKSSYVRLAKVGGAYDEGRDVVGYIKYPPLADGDWDNYQCKHYDHGLTPGEIRKEIGKTLFHCLDKKRPRPRKYTFVAPRGIGPGARGLFEKPDKLKESLIQKWDKEIKHSILSVPLELTDNLREYIEDTNFSLFTDLSPIELIETHRTTPYFPYRFGSNLPDRPAPVSAPHDIGAHETQYIQKILTAFSEDCGAILSAAGLSPYKTYQRDLKRAREDFYSAESLKNFSRDNLPNGAFEKVQDEVLVAIDHVMNDSYKNAYHRMRGTLRYAPTVFLITKYLKDYTSAGDKRGVCHQLANDDKINWKTDD